MKQLVILFFCMILFQVDSAVAQVDTASYSIGMSYGFRLKSQGAGELDYASFLQGIQDVLEGKETLFTRAYSDSLNYAYFQKQRNIMFEKQKEEGLNYLAENGKRPEVTTTASGLQYEVLTPAEGPKPTATSSVTVHYEGMLINGQIFDSSIARGEPISFPLSGVISGWTEGLQLMSVGSKYRFHIPQELGYGSRGAGGAIPPYSTLIFDVELLSFK